MNIKKEGEDDIEEGEDDIEEDDFENSVINM